MSSQQSPTGVAPPAQGEQRRARRHRILTLDARSDALAERVKELTCLHSIAGMLKRGHANLGEILQEVVEVLPSACRFPELARASITLNGRAYQTPGFDASRRRRSAAIVVGGDASGVLELGYGEDSDGRVPDFLVEEQLLLTTVVSTLSEIIELKEAQSQLATHRDHLRSLTAELTMAEERERRNLAIALHDRIGQGLAVAKLKLEAFMHVLPPEHRPEVEDITLLIKQIVADTRSLTSDISPPIVYELGLEPAVAWLCEHMTRQSGLPIEVQCEPASLELNEGLRIVLFRSIQELLVNTVKHAHASKATVRLGTHGAHAVFAVIEDDGIGFDVRARSRHPSVASGFGLFSIRERVGHLGGSVDIESSPGHGTRVHLVVPVIPPGRPGRKEAP
jgi:signal transduction histidine kinase